MFSCRTLTHSAKVCCRTLQSPEPNAVNLEKDNLAIPWNVLADRPRQFTRTFLPARCLNSMLIFIHRRKIHWKNPPKLKEIHLNKLLFSEQFVTGRSFTWAVNWQKEVHTELPRMGHLRIWGPFEFDLSGGIQVM